MKTTRFSSVVDACGRPEIYLLFDRNDPAFVRALKAGRVMTVSSQGSSTAQGVVGFDEKTHGQILLFPKSLKKFEATRIVGIKFDLFADAPAPKKAARKSPEKVRPVRRRAAKAAPQSKPSEAEDDASEDRKIIAFAADKGADEEADPVEELKKLARRALQALERRRLTEASRCLVQLLKS